MDLNVEKICNEYTTTNIGVESLALKYHVGKIKIKNILVNAGIQIKRPGGQDKKEETNVNNWKVNKYPEVDGKHYVAIDRASGFRTNDYNNKAGVLTTHIKKEYGVDIPTLYDRRKYYMKTGNYWWEQWFDIVLIDNSPTKKCSYCDWSTSDIDNKSGAYEQHLVKVHNISKIEHLEKHPEDRGYFTVVNEQCNRQMSLNSDEYVTCKICGKKLAKIDGHHLAVHNITKHQYITTFGYESLMSNSTLHKYRTMAYKMNMANESNNKYTSSYEVEIIQFIENLGFSCKKNRTLLDGKELDIYIPEKKLAIEFNGNKWHTEIFGGKNKEYHLDKLIKCEENGVRLIQIFEDEYVYHKDIVLSKIQHILKSDNSLPKIYGRKCKIKVIDRYSASDFLIENHIQGYSKSTIYIGAFFQDELIGVMSFLKERENEWNLTRFATSIKYICSGVGGKMFKYFISNYEYSVIKTFADRRWSTGITDNFYTVIGFKFDKIIGPDYRYYNSSIDRYARVHKFNLRKNKLKRIGNFTNEMTELEMAREIGYDRIWDCGLIRYIYTK